MKDWIDYTVELYPKTRQLGEHLNRKEYDEAYMLAVKIEADLRHLREWINNHNVDVTGLPPAQTVELPPKPAGGRSELT